MIRIPTVRVVDEEGRQLGVMPTFEALRLAQDRGYDLVEVAPNSVPPVTRLLDYGQYKYEAAKKEKEARRHQRSVEFKEIRIKPKIGTGDFDTKVRRAIEFLEDGDRVKVACQFRGRELTHAHLGRDLLLRFAELIRDHGAVERQPLLEGKSMSIVVASTHRPKTQAVEARPGDGSDGETTMVSAEGAPAVPSVRALPAPMAAAAGAEPPGAAPGRPDRPVAAAMPEPVRGHQKDKPESHAAPGMVEHATVDVATGEPAASVEPPKAAVAEPTPPAAAPRTATRRTVAKTTGSSPVGVAPITTPATGTTPGGAEAPARPAARTTRATAKAANAPSERPGE
jgi:translation initiation factor IF-3